MSFSLERAHGKLMNMSRELKLQTRAIDECWNDFVRVNNNYTIQGNVDHWLSCSIYIACQKIVKRAENRGIVVHKRNFVRPSTLLDLCNFSMLDFIEKTTRWIEMLGLPEPFIEIIENLEHAYAISNLVFQKFCKVYLKLFKDPRLEEPFSLDDLDEDDRLTSRDLMEFCWTLFISIKTEFPQLCHDLVDLFHLALCCIEYVYSNAISSKLKSLMDPTFKGLPSDFFEDSFESPKPLICVMDELSKITDMNRMEVKQMKAYMWKNAINTMINTQVIKGKGTDMDGVLEDEVFKYNLWRISKFYHDYYMRSGDFDEMQFFEDFTDKGVIGINGDQSAPMPPTQNPV